MIGRSELFLSVRKCAQVGLRNVSLHARNPDEIMREPRPMSSELGTLEFAWQARPLSMGGSRHSPLATVKQSYKPCLSYQKPNSCHWVS